MILEFSIEHKGVEVYCEYDTDLEEIYLDFETGEFSEDDFSFKFRDTVCGLAMDKAAQLEWEYKADRADFLYNYRKEESE